MKKLIPKRRFKEFENGKEWEQRKFEDVFVKLQNISLSRAVLNYTSGKAQNIHYGDILIKFGEYLDVKKVALPYVNENISIENHKTSFLKNGDILFADAAEDETVGKCCEVQGLTSEIIISGLHTIPCRPIENFGDGYLGYYLNSSSFHNQLLPLMQGTKVLSISRSTLNETDIAYPKSIIEQAKISNFFKQLDSLLTLHQRKLKKLKGLKSAYLSEMFPQEDEKYPKRRFVGFTEPWEQRRLNEFTTYDISHFSANQFNENNIVGNYPVFDANNEIARIKEYEQAGEYISIIKDGAGVGRCELRPAKSSVIATMGYVKTKDSDIKFLYALMQNICWENFIKGSTIPHVYYKDYGKKVFAIPTLKEQKLIGSFFCDLDSLITLHQRKLAKLSYLKSAYLSEMFV